MARLRYLTAGESHGRALATIVEGLPAGLPLTAEDVDRDLSRRQGGYGRGARQSIERDRVSILSGVRRGLTLGSPVAMLIPNRDWENWDRIMGPEPAEGTAERAFTIPRPGHADLSGALKYDAADLRDILERASARETAARVAVGAVCRTLLVRLGVTVGSLVESIGHERASVPEPLTAEAIAAVEASPFRSPAPEADARFRAAVDVAAGDGDTLGGIFRVWARGLLPGLGSHVHDDRRLDGRLAAALMSIPAVKGVEVGVGFAAASLTGSESHDEILPDGGRPGGVTRASNRAGGLEGGMTTGEELVLRAAMKPIPTLGMPLRSVDLATGAPAAAHRERSDVCAVPAAAVIGEAMVAIVLAGAHLEQFGGDTLGDLLAGISRYRDRLAKRPG